jgi:nucleoside-diphosphate-sugar epimerase
MVATKLVFGCGYLGERVARRWRSAGHDVTIVTRRAEKAADVTACGFRAIVADVTRPEMLHQLTVPETVLFAIGFDRTHGQSIEDVYAGSMKNVLAALPDHTGRVVYISTTGVYGSVDGGWVDEQTPPEPQRDGGRASLAAEQLLTTHPLGQRSVILRLAGLYGPGRVPYLDTLRAGQPIPVPTRGYLNLIHVDDAAAVVVAAGDLPPFSDGPRVYCVSDGRPVERGDYYREVARQMGAPPPLFIDPDRTSPRAARSESNRRVRNAKMLSELGMSLAYPDYRTGLAAILDTQSKNAV